MTWTFDRLMQRLQANKLKDNTPVRFYVEGGHEVTLLSIYTNPDGTELCIDIGQEENDIAEVKRIVSEVHKAEAKAMANRLDYWSGSYSMPLSEVQGAMLYDLRAATAFLRLIAEEL